MANNFTPATRGSSRAFFIKWRARPDRTADYQGCLMAGALDQALGDVSKIECPSPISFNEYIEIGQMRDAVERASSELTGRFPLNRRSDMKTLADIRCPLDVHINLGNCQQPTSVNGFTKKLILEQVFITNYSTTELGSLASSDDTEVDETGAVSVRNWYEVLELNTAERGADVVTNPLEDVVICSRISCGDCDDEDDGCERIYAVGDSGPGSPGTGPDVIYSLDRGVTLAADEIDTLTSSENADGIACLGDYVVVVSNDAGEVHYKLRATIDAGTAGGWADNNDNIAAGGEPNDIWSVGNYAFICGDAGYIYGMSVPTTITVLDAGVATAQNLAAIHALDDNFAVAVGAAGAVVYTRDRTTWQAATAPAAVALQAVWAKSEDEWYVGASNGAGYYTVDGGNTWTALAGFPVTLTNIEDICFSTDSVMYLSGQVAGPAGVILRSYDSGNTWVSIPEGVGTMPANDEVTAIAACQFDANFVVGVGLGDDASDGFYVVGQDNPA